MKRESIKRNNEFRGQTFCFSVSLPGYYIVENNIPRKVTREEFEIYAANKEVAYLAMGEQKKI